MDPVLTGVVISFVALAVAALALGWNMYRDRAAGAKVKVEAGLKEKPADKTGTLKGKYIAISVFNQGPRKVEIEYLWAADITFFKKVFLKGRGMMLNPVESFQLPREVSAGERIDLLLPFHEECFLKDNFSTIGVLDGFDREHWVPKTQILALRKEYRRSFLGGKF